MCNVSNLACILWTLVFSLVQSASQTQAVVKLENKYTNNNSPVKTENMKLSAPKTLKEQLWIIDSKPFLISVWSQKAGAVAVVLSSFGTGWGKKKKKKTPWATNTSQQRSSPPPASWEHHQQGYQQFGKFWCIKQWSLMPNAVVLFHRKSKLIYLFL